MEERREEETRGEKETYIHRHHSTGVRFQEGRDGRYRAQAAAQMNIPLAQALLVPLSGHTSLLSGSQT